MDKEKFYTGIKNTLYRKFNNLEEIDQVNYLFLRYKNEEYAEIVVDKKSGEVYYYYNGFCGKIYDIIPLERLDFEALLGRWVEDTFKIKVEHVGIDYYRRSCLELKIPIK